MNKEFQGQNGQSTPDQKRAPQEETSTSNVTTLDANNQSNLKSLLKEGPPDMIGEWSDYDLGKGPPSEDRTILPSFLEEKLSHPPASGGNFHNWLFCVARQLHCHFPEDPEQIYHRLREPANRCGRDVPDREIWNAINNSKDCAYALKTGGVGYGSDFQVATTVPASKPAPRWPVRDKDKIDSIVREGPRLHDLSEMSRAQFDPGERIADRLVDQLFPGNPLLCVGKSQQIFWTRAREEWRGFLHRTSLIVPSPMTKIRGLTKDGRLSEHTLEAVGPRRFLVLEFDFSILTPNGLKETEWSPLIRAWEENGIGVPDACAALLVYLRQYAPLALVVHSGGKSFHGWFPCHDRTEDQLKRFMRHAHTVGACPSTWCPSQFVRVPDGTRNNGKRQTVYYVNPEVL